MAKMDLRWDNIFDAWKIQSKKYRVFENENENENEV